PLPVAPAPCLHCPDLLHVALRPPRLSPPFPYTTLFRSRADRAQPAGEGDRIVTRLRVERHRERAELRVAGAPAVDVGDHEVHVEDRKSTRLNSSHVKISYAVFCLKKKKKSRYSKPQQIT